MDPLSALGVAASVVQFIDFASTLVSSTYKIYNSTTGDTKQKLDLKVVTSSLKSLSNDLKLSLDQDTPVGEELSKVDTEINTLCASCSEVADELILALEKLNVQKEHDIWQSFRTALQSVWGRKEVDSLEKRLQAFRSQISLHINASLREQVQTLQTSQSNQGQIISTSLQVTQELAQSLLKHMNQNTRWQAKVLDAINANQDYSSPLGDARALLSNTQDQFYKDYATRFRDGLLQSLKYQEMESRSERVANAYPQTLEWIFSNASEEKLPSFVQFLEGDQRLYWVTGKPGSGKSTLMKFICNDPRTKHHLSVWGSTKDIFLSQFYFWCSGSEMQMSQEGLIRTLLYQAVQELPHLGPSIFPDRLETSVVFGSDVVWDAEWSMAELHRAYKQLVLEVTKSRKMFILVDGLDEFNGNYSEQLSLVSFLHSLLGDNVKICVSSRPWNVFEDAFKSRPSLTIEDLTYSDIQHYISTKLSDNLGFIALQQGEPDLASDLIDKVSTKACGVFLWVILVVQSLLEGLTDGERLSDLQKRLDSLPADLETLFWKILKSVDFERISQLLQIVESSKNVGSEPLNILRMSFADEDDAEFAFKMPALPLTEAKIATRVELMRRRLNACGKGLLETPKTGHQLLPDAEVGYLHRTVKDFVQQPEIWSKIREATPSEFDPTARLAASYIALFKINVTSTGRPEAKIVENGDASGPPGFCRPFFQGIQAIIGFEVSMEFAARLLDEFAKAAESIMAKGLICRPLTYTDFRFTGLWPISSFLQLAVRLQRSYYVKTHVKILHQEGKIEQISRLLQIAAADYKVYDSKRLGCKLDYEVPNPDIIETLLQFGADPNKRLLSYKETVWEFVIRDTLTTPEMLKLFLRHGASPHAPLLTSSKMVDLCKEDTELRNLIHAKKKEVRGHRFGSKKTQEPKSSENSMWSPQRFGRRSRDSRG